MFNSAIEATVDLVSPNYSPLAKFAKDIAAGEEITCDYRECCLDHREFD